MYLADIFILSSRKMLSIANDLHMNTQETALADHLKVSGFVLAYMSFMLPFSLSHQITVR